MLERGRIGITFHMDGCWRSQGPVANVKRSHQSQLGKCWQPSEQSPTFFGGEVVQICMLDIG